MSPKFLFTTLISATVALGIILFGSGAIKANVRPTISTEAQPLPVAVSSFVLESGYQSEIQFLGSVQASSDSLLGFEVGADDYIAKPFNPHILLAKIKAVLKRGTKIASLAYRRNTNSYYFNDWVYNGKKDIIISPTGFQISLSKKETTILKVFLANSHVSLTREEIANSIDDTRTKDSVLDLAESRAIDVLVGRLRSKIEKDSKKNHHVGMGFIINYNWVLN